MESCPRPSLAGPPFSDGGAWVIAGKTEVKKEREGPPAEPPAGPPPTTTTTTTLPVLACRRPTVNIAPPTPTLLLAPDYTPGLKARILADASTQAPQRDAMTDESDVRLFKGCRRY